MTEPLIEPLIDTLHALARLIEAESEALAACHAPDALGTLAAAKARLIADLGRLGAKGDDARLTAAAGILHDATQVHAAVVHRMLQKKFRTFDRMGRTRV